MREKLIELQKEAVRNCEPGSECLNCRYMGQADCMERLTADYMVANGVTIQKWIPVSERLPDKITNKVIVLCKNGYRGFGHYEDYKGEQTWYNLESDKPFTDWDLEDCESYEVTHWMPTPQPPKED